MNPIVISVALFSALLWWTPATGQGRRPTLMEHRYCNLMYDQELNQARTVDRFATAQAYNIGRNGTASTLCKTHCRILSRGNVRIMEPITSPDFIICAYMPPSYGHQYCYKGNCTEQKDLAQTLYKIRTTQTVSIPSNASDQDNSVNVLN